MGKLEREKKGKLAGKGEAIPCVMMVMVISMVMVIQNGSGSILRDGEVG